MVTNLIIQRLEAGVVPWQMPWKSSGCMPKNLISKKTYRGFNFWYLISFGYERPFFLTFNQAKALNGSVKKGAKSIQVVFWKLNEYTDSAGELQQKPMLRYYRVFNIEDVEGIPENKIPVTKAHDHEFSPIQACEKIIQNWNDIPPIESGKSEACYFPGLDKIHMPNPRNFFKDEGYYATLFHELTHSTGHRKRTNRHSLFPNLSFASKDYSQEELVAEMGASFLCGITGIENTIIDNSAAYIQSWLGKLRSDKKFIIQASTHAQTAVDYVLQNQTVPVSPELVEIEEEEMVFEF